MTLMCRTDNSFLTVTKKRVSVASMAVYPLGGGWRLFVTPPKQNFRKKGQPQTSPKSKNPGVSKTAVVLVVVVVVVSVVVIIVVAMVVMAVVHSSCVVCYHLEVLVQGSM